VSEPAVDHRQQMLPTMAEAEALLSGIEDRVLTEDDLARYISPTQQAPRRAPAPVDQDLKVHNNTTISFRELVKVFTACGVPGVTVKSLRAIKERWGTESTTHPALLGFPVRVRDVLLARVLLEVARTTPTSHSQGAEDVLAADARWVRDLAIRDVCAAVWDTRPVDERPDTRLLVMMAEQVTLLTTLSDLPVGTAQDLVATAVVMPIGAWADELRDHMDTYRPPKGYRKPAHLD